MNRTKIELPPLLQLQELRFRCGIELTFVEVLELACRCPELQRLEITVSEYPVSQLTDWWMEEVLRCCPQLVSWKLDDTAFSKKTILKAVKQRPQLRFIYVP
jgi:hypothetical protein